MLRSINVIVFLCGVLVLEVKLSEGPPPHGCNLSSIETTITDDASLIAFAYQNKECAIILWWYSANREWLLQSETDQSGSSTN